MSSSGRSRTASLPAIFLSWRSMEESIRLVRLEIVAIPAQGRADFNRRAAGFRKLSPIAEGVSETRHPGTATPAVSPDCSDPADCPKLLKQVPFATLRDGKLGADMQSWCTAQP